jgi:hypothetical protein
MFDIVTWFSGGTQCLLLLAGSKRAAEGLGGFWHTVLFKEITAVSKAVEQGAGRLCIIKDHFPFA